MPETPVDKHRQSQRAKHKIRFPEQLHPAPPPANAMRAKNPYQPQLGILVPRTANPRHHSGALCLGEDVRHFL
jgi:hypothetical protein